MVGDDVHVSVRSVGYVRSAGDVTRAAFGDLGSAGGHRTMAKAVVPLAALCGPDRVDAARCQERLAQRFLRALGQNGKT